MASQKQIDANRRNALKSTGPTSDSGKAASSQNATKSGIFAKASVIKGENPDDLQALINDYYAHHNPTTPELRAILDDLINTEWELRRLTRAEAEMWNHQIEDSWTAGRDKHPIGKAATLHCQSFGYLQRRLDSTRRARDRALKLLREHGANPIPVQPEPAVQPEAPSVTPNPTTTSPEIGFVSAPPPQAPPAAFFAAETDLEAVLS